ncbi:unnamed protein product [Lymnaea stagnalis]|uniref:Uncharacterized protein n=1 Tax=Lymnaea stagnalis TaxID=6523 RepID=A0AAV2H2N1_LYMST
MCPDVGSDSTESTGKIIQMLSYVESNKMMRYSRPWYIFPFLVNLALLFSATHLVTVIDQDVMEDTLFPIPSWILYATMAVVTPTTLATIRLLPDPSLPLLAGGVLTSAGLLWTSLETGALQMVAFGVLAGTGISLSLQAMFVALSPYFIRGNIKASVGTLLLSMVVMVTLFPLMSYATHALSTRVFLYLAPLTFLSSLVPSLIYFTSRCGAQKPNKVDKEVLQRVVFDSSCVKSVLPIETNSQENGCCCAMRNSLNQYCGKDGWAASLISFFVWLSWGAGIDTTWISLLLSPGVDTTWLTMGWRYQYFNSTTGLAALQLFLCFILLAVKMSSEISQTQHAQCRSNLASNYMQLGLLGVGGVLLYFLPSHSNQFHNHLLFTVGLAQQYDDLTDLYLMPSNSFSFPNNQYQLVKYRISIIVKEGEAKCISVWTVCCLFCHMVSLLLMSCLAMILGVQVANIIGILSTLPPLSFLCARVGLLIMSVAAICVSLMRPDTWIGRKHPLLII